MRLLDPSRVNADDYAPEKSKSKWFAMFYLCIPVGFALGYILGGLAAPALGWRAAFFIEGSVMIPFVIFCLQASSASSERAVGCAQARVWPAAPSARGAAARAPAGLVRPQAQPLQLHGTTSQKALLSTDEAGDGAGGSPSAAAAAHGHKHASECPPSLLRRAWQFGARAGQQSSPGERAADTPLREGTVPHRPHAVAAKPSTTRAAAGFWHKVRHHAGVFWADVRVVLRQRVFVMTCVAYTLYVAVLGVYAYW